MCEVIPHFRVVFNRNGRCISAKDNVLFDLTGPSKGILLAKTQTMAHLLRCPLLERKCKAKDLADYNDVAKKCVQHWLKHSIYDVCGYDKKKKLANLK